MVEDSWDKVLEIVESRLPKGYELSEAQRTGLLAAWQKKKYKDFYRSGFSDGYLSNVLIPVYAILSESFGVAVRKNNFREIIKDSILGNVISDEVPKSLSIYGKPPRTELFIGREEDLALIDTIYTEKNVIIINGSKGIGKTSLASTFFQRISKTNSFQKYVWYSVQQTSIEDNVSKINALLEFKRLSPQQDDFLEQLSQHKTCIVIDGIDLLLPSYLVEVNSLIESLARMPHSSLIIMTSRNMIPSSKLLERQGYPLSIVKLKGLSYEASKALFDLKGVVHKKIHELIDSVRGIPAIILETSEKISLMNGDVELYLKNKTLFAAFSEKENLDKFFSDKTNEVQLRERYILYLLINSTEKVLNINDFMNQVERNSEYTQPEILESIEILDDSSLISIDRTANSVKLLKHDEVRGYVAQDPLKLFQFEKTP